MSLLAITFAFSLATFGTAVAVSVRAYLNAALGQERAIIDRISLESAIASTQDQLASGLAHPMAPTTLDPTTINGRTIKVEISVPEHKWDLMMDSPADLRAALAVKGLAHIALTSRHASLAQFASDSSFTAGQEDCFRRGFTLGRAPAPRLIDSLSTSNRDLRRTMSAGDQIDIRVGVSGMDVENVLWTRSRLIGSSGRWATHDYRQLRVIKTSCMTPGAPR